MRQSIIPCIMIGLCGSLLGCSSSVSYSNSGYVNSNSVHSSSQAVSQPPKGAVLVAPSKVVQHELSLVISSMLNVSTVNLPEDVFTSTSYLTLERPSASDAQGRLVMGRSTEMPENFQLINQGDSCAIIRLSTGVSVELLHAKCQPEGE